METQIVTTLIPFFGSLLIAAITYWFTKQREREAEWRKEKVAYYKDFIESLSGIVEGDSSPEGHRAFAKATNNLLLFAPQPVIAAVKEFRLEISISNTSRTQDRHDSLLATLLLAIRRDIGMSPKDVPDSFNPILWASGADKSA